MMIKTSLLLPIFTLSLIAMPAISAEQSTADNSTTHNVAAVSPTAVFAETDSFKPDTGSSDMAVEVPEIRAMGGAKSVTTFFITSKGLGNGADLGGLAGADAHCQALAAAEYAGDHTWRAYLSIHATDSQVAINARDRIGGGPWYNGEGLLVAASLEELHGGDNRIDKSIAASESLNPINGFGDSPNQHDMLTGSDPQGRALAGDLSCGNWTSSGAGQAQVGHHDLLGQGEQAGSWNSAHATKGCSQQLLQSSAGAGLFYCFAID